MEIVLACAQIAAMLLVITTLVRQAIWQRKTLKEARAQLAQTEADLLAQKLRTTRAEGEADAWTAIRRMLAPDDGEE